MQPRWMREVVKGSVLAEGSGTWRVVREAHRKPNGDLWGVTFAIRHCSWTGRCYTILTATDLKVRGFRLVRVAPRKLRSVIDRRIAASIRDHHARPYPATCCDVEGVA
jgi:hypothetical protein